MNNQPPPPVYPYKPDPYRQSESDPYRQSESDPYRQSESDVLHITKEVNKLRHDLEEEKDKRHQTNDILLIGGVAATAALCCNVL